MREMKDSGIEWIGKIPNEWVSNKLKYHFTNEKLIVGTRVDNYQRLALTMNGVIKRSKEDNEGLQPTEFKGYQILKVDELVFKLIDLQNTSTSRVGLSGYTGIVSPAYIILRGKGTILPSFAEKFFISMWYRNIFNHLGDSGVRSNLNAKELLSVNIVYPSIFEQQKIADFLDQKCSEIDALTTDIQTQIETLEEYKKSVITEAVTKGLDPNVEMKDSGVEWIGKIPTEWDVEKLKYNLFRHELRNYIGKSQVLSVYREYGVIPKDSRSDNHNVTSEDTSNYKLVKPNNLVINKMKAWQGSMGISNYEGIVSPAYFIYKFSNKKILPQYLHYLLRSCYKDEFRRISGGIREGQWDLSPSLFENTLLLIPSVVEQDKIVSHITQKCSEIDLTISEKQQQLETLVEYKKSLIYEYVTGKKEVA